MENTQPIEVIVFQTTDLGVASVLKYAGFQLQELKPLDQRRFTFIFLDPQHTARAVSQEYWNSEFFKFFSAMKSMKDHLHQVREMLQ